MRTKDLNETLKDEEDLKHQKEMVEVSSEGSVGGGAGAVSCKETRD